MSDSQLWLHVLITQEHLKAIDSWIILQASGSQSVIPDQYHHIIYVFAKNANSWAPPQTSQIQNSEGRAQHLCFNRKILMQLKCEGIIAPEQWNQNLWNWDLCIGI